MSCRLVDFHAHILPRVDHGSSSLEVSLDQMRAYVKRGIYTVVSTSHYYPNKDDLKLFLSIRDEAYDELRSAMSEQGIELDIRLGAEVLLCAGLDKLPGLEKLCIKGTNILLIELPFSDFMGEYLTTLENLIEMGFKVVLAHVDRYPAEIIDMLSYLDLSFQMNADSLAVFFKRPKLYEWIGRGKVVALGSDIHMLNFGALDKLVKCSKKLKDDFSLIMNKAEQLLG